MPSPDDIESALSLERFSRYVAWAAGDRRAAVELYSLNARISEALYIPIHGLEIALRNRIQARPAASAGRSNCQLLQSGDRGEEPVLRD